MTPHRLRGSLSISRRKAVLLIATGLLALSPAEAREAHAAAPTPARAVRPAPTPPRPTAPRAIRPAPALERDTLAWVGDRAITALDLVQRIEWMPWPEKRGPASMDSAKVHALESLVGEALLARENERRLPNDTARVTPMRAALRRALTRDALFQQVVSQAPTPDRTHVERVVNALYPGASRASLPALRRAVADSLRTAVGEERAAQFLLRHLSSQRVQVDSVVFMLLADSLRAHMIRAADDPVPGGGIIVPAEAADALRSRLAGSLGRTLADLPGGPLTLGDALDNLQFYLFAVHSLERRRFALELNANLRRVVEGELMAREGARRGLDRSPQVRRDVERWTSVWRANDQIAALVAGVQGSDDDAFRTLALTEPERARRVCEVDVSEILCGTRAEARALLGEIGLGARFDSLALARTRRPDWQMQHGRSGWIAVSDHAALGYATLLAPRDSLVGPVQLPEGFALLRAHGKRLRADSAGAAPLLERARAMATGELRVQHVARAVAELAESSRVEMNLAALRRVEILPANMVVKRSLGFGGGMTASPSLMPLWHWAPLWRGREIPVP